MRRLVPWLLIVVACDTGGSDSASETDGSSSSETSASSDPSGPGTTSTTGTSGGTEPNSTDTSSSGSGDSEGSSTSDAPACDTFTPSENFEIASGQHTTRIHPHAVGDARGAWFTYVEPEPAGSLFDVVALHLDCTLQADVPPFAVNTEVGNDIDPSVAISGDRVVVLWNSDNGQGGSDNLQIHYRRFALDGTPLDETQRRLTTQVDGDDILGNHTNANVVGSDLGWTVAGIRAHPGSPAFVAFLQHLDPQGDLLGEAFSPFVDPSVSHLAASGDESWIGYAVSGRGFDEVRVANEAGDPAIVPFPDASSGGIHLVATPSGPLVAASSGDSGPDILISMLESEAPPLRLGEPGTTEHSPMLALGPDSSAAVVYHRVQAGAGNTVVFQRLTLAGDTVSANGEPEDLDTMSPPYPPSVTALPNGTWLATWARGQSPAFTTWGRVLD